MSEHGADTPEQVLKFVPKERPRSDGALVEEAGEAIIAKIQKAADLSNENCDRAMKLAHKLSMQLRAAEERINQLEAEVELFRDRAARAERWLQTIQKEIEQKLIAPRSASSPEQTSLPQACLVGISGTISTVGVMDQTKVMDDTLVRVMSW